MDESEKQEVNFQEIIKATKEKSPSQSNILAYIYPRIRYLTDNNSVLLEKLPTPELFIIIRPFLAHKEPENRTTALRIYRYLSNTKDKFSLLKSSHIEYFLVRSFELEGKPVERIEACKLIRRWLEISPESFPKSLCNSLVSLSDTENDDLKEFGLEALRLLSITNTLLVSWSGGIRCLINALLDIKCSQELSENIIYTICYLLNEPETRVYLKNGQELMRILGVFTDYNANIKESDLEILLKLARRATLIISRSWSGLIFLASSGLRDIIMTLVHPGKNLIKEGILDTISDMISIPVEISPRNYNLLNNYLAVLIRALLHCELHPALTQLALDPNVRISQRARKLLKLITRLGPELLPEAPTCPVSFIKGSAGRGAELIADMDSYSRINNEFKEKNLLFKTSEFISSENPGVLNPPNSLLNSIFKNHLSHIIDDNQFYSLINKSQILREPSKWDWEAIYEILSGPISVGDRLTNVATIKFLKSLIIFYTPSKSTFVCLPWASEHFMKAKIGNMLISFLLLIKNGRKLLTSAFSESFFVIRKSFVEEMIDAIDEEIRCNEGKNTSNARILTPDNVRFTMTREYFRWLGLLLNHRYGRKILKSLGFIPNLVKIAEIEHLAPILLSVLDYKEQISQQFLLFSLQSKRKLVKIRSLQQIFVIFRAGIFDVSWAIGSIVNLLYLSDTDLIKLSLNTITEICQHRDNLNTLIQTRPQKLLKLDSDGKSILLKFLASQTGIEYLCEMDFLDDELKDWDDFLNIEYARTIEEKIETGLNSQKKSYGIVLNTPKIFVNYGRLQLSWLSSLPLYFQVQMNSKTINLDTYLEVDKEDIFYVSYLGIKVSDIKETILVCLKLGNSFIDNYGNETPEPSWIRCRKDIKNPSKSITYTVIENDGIFFTFSETENSLTIESIKFRAHLLPKGIPAVQVPKHFFGELGKTKLGFNKLISSKVLEKYTQKLMEKHTIIEKRAWMWALGHAGSTNHGAEYLISIKAIRQLVEIAEKSLILSLRGTAIQTLSLISRSAVGRKELLKYFWTSKPENNSISISVPLDSNKIFWLEDRSIEFMHSDKCKEVEMILDSIELSDKEKEIYEHVCKIGSVIDKTESEGFLRDMRAATPLALQSIPLFHAVMTTLSGYSFKLSVRRKIHKLLERIYRVPNVNDVDNLIYIS
ncbi:hypothetical protein SteCoe_16860 [Stentor coeruleus]|uniref:Rapamycin-insensitive companion of mTOR domain-containing protein n=1 Tax=Stentor coeruleus TaxID=5963 RepID=A0A1R2C0C5_9CILI|nr:hypothetical protein SteCoe_16860 [Stentor coeruleus]